MANPDSREIINLTQDDDSNIAPRRSRRVPNPPPINPRSYDANGYSVDAQGRILPRQRYIIVATDLVQLDDGRLTRISIGARLAEKVDRFQTGPDIHYGYDIDLMNEPVGLRHPPLEKNKTTNLIANRQQPNLLWEPMYMAPSGKIHSREDCPDFALIRRGNIITDWYEAFRPATGGHAVLDRD